MDSKEKIKIQNINSLKHEYLYKELNCFDTILDLGLYNMSFRYRSHERRKEMIKRFKFNGRFNQAVVINGILFLAGQTGTDAGDDIVSQTKQTLENINAALTEYGSDKQHILRADVYVSKMEDVAEFNKIWEEWVDPNAAPTRALMVSSLGRPEVLIEIIVIAAIKEE